MDDDWRSVAERQDGLIARSALGDLGVSRGFLRAQIAARRWQRATPTVIATFTGTLSREQLMWCGVLHAGPASMVGGLTATELAGLKRWDRPEVTILVPQGTRSPRPVDGIDFKRTERTLKGVRASPWGLPRALPAPAALLWASTQPSSRSAAGLMHALVQQRICDEQDIAHWVERIGRLRHGDAIREAIGARSQGIQSVAEQDLARLCRTFKIAAPTRQTRRRDAIGRNRFTDAEWPLQDGRRLILEVDGAFHMNAEQWEDDIVRQRDLAERGIVPIHCTARELRDEPDRVARSLIRMGVPTIAVRKRSS